MGYWVEGPQPTNDELQEAARFRGVFPPFPSKVSTDDLIACAEYRDIELTGEETADDIKQLLSGDE